ncbi:hypothetical protein SAMN05216226_102122 [Halovenus aranensis]|uniref:Uncharacterized protein n=1 Tax=Halovenus aranensis TaxID=890420 RepID=A0A1G8SS42_9EURY|nr:hypothetical protein [Halovenus aranensis]SDJ32066.1 hypothetical protein SAMN05216226_102122 [Halovenus aranensis]
MVAGDGRGQALTLEAVVASVLILAAIGFALQMTAVTPLSASTSSQHVENQLQSTSEGVLDSVADTGALREAVLYWNKTTGEFHGDASPFYRSGPPPNAFGDALSAAFGTRNVAYNVFVHYQTGDGIATQQMVRQGQPSDHAVSASHTLVLTTSDRLVGPDERGPRLGAVTDDEFYVARRSSGPYYNLVRIEVVAWCI